MTEMSVQARYNEIATLSGQSEEVVRRVLRAAKQSLAQSIRNGSRATLPGICTMVPEQREKLVVGSIVPVKYIKIKAKASNAMETELNKDVDTQEETDNSMDKLNIINDQPSGIRVRQISALI